MAGWFRQLSAPDVPEGLFRLLPEHGEPEYVVPALGGVVNYNTELVNARLAWSRTKGEGVRVAVLDTGVPRHKDLRVAGWKSFVRGYDFDENGHATGVGSIIAGSGIGGTGIMGIAPGCDVWYGAVMNDCGVGSLSSVADGIRWAVDEVGADVVNLSLGTPGAAGCSDEVQSACEYALGKGAMLVAAAGNDGHEVNCPALMDGVVAVGAVDRKLRMADFSSYGPEVEFVAGGVDVLVAWKGGGYASMSGTSFSAPVLTGMSALLISWHRMNGEPADAEHVRLHLREMAVDLGDEGRDEMTGWGIPVFARGRDSSEAESDGSPRWPKSLRAFLTPIASIAAECTKSAFSWLKSFVLATFRR